MRKTKFYTPNGWSGMNQRSSIRPKEVANLLRAYAREMLKGIKFSVTSTHNSVSVAVMEAPTEMLTDNTKSYLQVSEWGIEENKNLTDEGRELMSKVASFLRSYNYNDDDLQTDYYDSGFFTHLSIGKWNNPFKTK